MLDGCPVLGKKLQQTGYIFIAPLSRPRNTKRVSPSFLFCWNVRNGRLRHSPLSSSFWYRKDSTFVLDIADLWDHFLEEFPSIIRPEDCAKGREEGTEEFRHRDAATSSSAFLNPYLSFIFGIARHCTGDGDLRQNTGPEPVKRFFFARVDQKAQELIVNQKRWMASVLTGFHFYTYWTE